MNNLMQYTRSGASSVAQKTTHGARKYVGDVATGYDAKRQAAPKWAAEQRIIEAIIDDLPEGSTVLDVPVGTGRFISAYERNGHIWTGVDASQDMIFEAKKKIADASTGRERTCQCEVGRLDHFFEKNEFDLSIMCRLTRWLTPEQRTQAMAQLKRVTKSAIVFTARVADHPYAYPYEDIKRDLGPDWVIESDWSADGPNYCVIRAVPCEVA